MVASRKPRKATPGHPRETLEETFQRLIALPLDAPFPKLTEREARYFLQRLAGSNPAAPSGIEVLRAFYGDWSEDEIDDE
ncbi:MAG TPA: hypothetical protein VEZ14_06310 [Dehalococcoidia bacterium]|nr:hypothetical protein [Dehalococcoidia bacterium]